MPSGMKRSLISSVSQAKTALQLLKWLRLLLGYKNEPTEALVGMLVSSGYNQTCDPDSC